MFLIIMILSSAISLDCPDLLMDGFHKISMPMTVPQIDRLVASFTIKGLSQSVSIIN
jgi:hypothetical protein